MVEIVGIEVITRTTWLPFRCYRSATINTSTTSKAAQADIQSYQDCLNRNLDIIEISDGYLNCNNPHCTNVLHRRFIEVYYHYIIESCIKASSVSIPPVRPNV